MFEDLIKYETLDYQNRGGSYPKSDIPVDIRAYDNELLFAFKNTDQQTAEGFVRDFIKKIPYTVIELYSFQTGDYLDDYVEVSVKFKEGK